MSDQAGTISCAAQIPIFEHRLIRPSLGRWCELSAVLLLAIGPFLLNSIHFYRFGTTFFGEQADAGLTFAIIQEITSLLLLGYVLVRRKIHLKDLGLRWSMRGILIGFVLALASYAAYWAVYHFLIAMHDAFWPAVAFTPEPSWPGGRPALLSVVLMCINPFFEELIVRVYLMTEVHALTGSWGLAVVLSTLVQTSYHIYYGWIVMLALAFQFLVFSLFYARKRQAAPLIVAHGYFDLYWVLLGLL